MTPRHMIKYGRSSYVKWLTSQLNLISKKKVKITKRFALNVRDYLIVKLCIINGMRASNIIYLKVNVLEATKSVEHHDDMVFVNSTHKTSTIYGEKVIALPECLFHQLYVSCINWECIDIIV